MVNIATEELKKLVETAIQFGIDSPELVTNRKGREKIANWMVENTINDLKDTNHEESSREEPSVKHTIDDLKYTNHEKFKEECSREKPNVNNNGIFYGDDRWVG